MYQNIFERYEKKYLLSREQYRQITNALSYNTVPDEYGESRVCSLYYDTPDHRLIRASLEKPFYKEKLRLRCYGIPGDNSNCFVELKKKCDGIVYKRRICTGYRAGIGYLAGEEYNLDNAQISREIDYFLQYYHNIAPAMACFYDRHAIYDRNDPALRITFDRNIICRDYDLDLRRGVYGSRLLPDGKILMELKIPGAMPVWLADLLDVLKIFPTSFSKYGTAYRRLILEKNDSDRLERGDNCA